LTYDFAIIGAGISGAAAAYELAQHGSVLILEAELAPGYHSTGRSAALYTPNLGNSVVRRINRASRAFLNAPPAGFCEVPLLSQRGLLTVAGNGDEGLLSDIVDRSDADSQVDRRTAQQACEMVPLLRPECVSAALYEPAVADIEVAVLHQAYLRAAQKAGGVLARGKRITDIMRIGRHWRLEAGDSHWECRIIINAAGAWSDEVGAMAGAKLIGLVPKRRTAIVVALPQDVDSQTLPAVDFAGSEAYFKPEGGKLMASFGDQTPVEPQDVRPEEIDIAVAADWLSRHTYIEVDRVDHSWAGLRSYVDDGLPVVGFDAVIPDFFWLAGQGGYGIMMAPSLGQATSSLLVDNDLTKDLLASGLTKDQLSPDRLS
jgi:D-arginine dehydrogenase